MLRGSPDPYRGPGFRGVRLDGSRRGSFPPRQRAPRRGARCTARPSMMQTSQASMLVATVPTIEGRPVQWYLGIVSGEAVAERRLGATGESGAHPIDLRDARDTAIFEMLREAAERGANAVVGVDLGYESIHLNSEGTTLMVTASGTAVRV